MDLPSNPTPEDLDLLRKYLEVQEKSSSANSYGKQNYYQDKEELMGRKLIIFRHKQKKKDVYYMRFYVGNKKYKTLSLRTSDRDLAVEKALDKWRTLQNHLESGGEVFEVTTEQSLDDYLTYLQDLVQIRQLKILTANC